MRRLQAHQLFAFDIDASFNTSTSVSYSFIGDVDVHCSMECIQTWTKINVSLTLSLLFIPLRHITVPKSVSYSSQQKVHASTNVQIGSSLIYFRCVCLRVEEERLDLFQSLVLFCFAIHNIQKRKVFKVSFYQSYTSQDFSVIEVLFRFDDLNFEILDNFKLELLIKFIISEISRTFSTKF